MVARRKLCYKARASEHSEENSGRKTANLDDHSAHPEIVPEKSSGFPPEVIQNVDEVCAKAVSDIHVPDGPERNGKPVRLSLVSAASLECAPEPIEPPGWCILNCGFDEFSKRRKEWSIVENKTDLAIFDIPEHEQNQDNIDKLIRHVGNCLRVTGVAHAFCALSQFFKDIDAASKIGLSAITNPVVYIQDAKKTRRLSFSLQPQNIVEYAAVFYKTSRKSDEKHYYSANHSFEPSVTPSWSNVMSNIAPSYKRLMDSNGKPFHIRERSKEMYKVILRQWCRPGGVVYHPFGKAMAVGLATYDISIKYVAIEEDQNCFGAAKDRLFEAMARPIKENMLEEDHEDAKRTKRRTSALSEKNSTQRSSQKELRELISSDEDSENSVFFNSAQQKQQKKNIETKSYPDRQLLSDEEERNDQRSGHGHITSVQENCAAGDQCMFSSISSTPAHKCGVCGAPVHNQCEYGKRVLKDFNREQSFSCSSKCYSLEKKN